MSPAQNPIRVIEGMCSPISAELLSEPISTAIRISTITSATAIRMTTSISTWSINCIRLAPIALRMPISLARPEASAVARLAKSRQATARTSAPKK